MPSVANTSPLPSGDQLGLEAQLLSEHSPDEFARAAHDVQTTPGCARTKTQCSRHQVRTRATSRRH